MPIYKKEDRNDKQNFRPVIVLSNLWKLLKKFIYSQINAYMSDKFFKYLTRFLQDPQYTASVVKYDWKLEK